MKFRLKQNVGKHYHNGDAVEPGEVIDVCPEDVKYFMDKFEPMEDLEPEKHPEPIIGLKAVKIGADTYDVINEVTGEPINDTPLSLDDVKGMMNVTFEEDDDA